MTSHCDACKFWVHWAREPEDHGYSCAPCVNIKSELYMVVVRPDYTCEHWSENIAQQNKVNGVAVCDCGHTLFYVGIKYNEATTENHIKMLECTRCGHQMAVPFTQGR